MSRRKWFFPKFVDYAYILVYNKVNFNRQENSILNVLKYRSIGALSYGYPALLMFCVTWTDLQKSTKTFAVEYMAAQETSIKWNVSLRWVQRLCKENRIEGALNVSRIWLIPRNAKKPIDRRTYERKEKRNG